MTGADFFDRIAKARELTLKIMANLDDRKGILSDIDHAVKQEIEKDIGLIILDDYTSWGNRDTLCNCDPASQPDDSDRYDHGDNAELALLELLYDIRKAAGDPEGKLMQNELVARIAKMSYQLSLIERMAATGTAKSFLALSEENKRKFFAMAVDESSRRKEAEARIDAAQALIVDWRTRIPPDAPDTTRIVMREWCADELEQALGKGEK